MSVILASYCYWVLHLACWEWSELANPTRKTIHSIPLSIIESNLSPYNLSINGTLQQKPGGLLPHPHLAQKHNIPHRSLNPATLKPPLLQALPSQYRWEVHPPIFQPQHRYPQIPRARPSKTVLHRWGLPERVAWVLGDIQGKVRNRNHRCRIRLKTDRGYPIKDKELKRSEVDRCSQPRPVYPVNPLQALKHNEMPITNERLVISALHRTLALQLPQPHLILTNQHNRLTKALRRHQPYHSLQQIVRKVRFQDNEEEKEI